MLVAVFFIYKLSIKTTFTLTCDIYRSKDIGFTFTLCAINYFVHVCYSRVYNTIKIERFNKNILNETLRPSCQVWLSYSFYISRINNIARTCLQNLKHYVTNDDFDVNYTMSVCCFECFKHFLCNLLYNNFYTF